MKKSTVEKPFGKQEDEALETNNPALWRSVAQKMNNAYNLFQEKYEKALKTRNQSDIEDSNITKNHYIEHFQMMQNFASVFTLQQETSFDFSTIVNLALPKSFPDHVRQTLVGEQYLQGMASLKEFKKIMDHLPHATTDILTIRMDPQIANNIALTVFTDAAFKNGAVLKEFTLSNACPTLLCSMIQRLSNLEKLDLSDNIAGIMNNKSVDAESGEIDVIDESEMVIAKLARAVEVNCNLQHLALRNCGINSDQALRLVDALTKIPKQPSFSLDIRGNNIDPDTKAQILQISEASQMAIKINDNIENGVAAAQAAAQIPNPQFQVQSSQQQFSAAASQSSALG